MESPLAMSRSTTQGAKSSLRLGCCSRVCRATIDLRYKDLSEEIGMRNAQEARLEVDREALEGTEIK